MQMSGLRQMDWIESEPISQNGGAPFSNYRLNRYA